MNRRMIFAVLGVVVSLWLLSGCDGPGVLHNTPSTQTPGPLAEISTSPLSTPQPTESATSTPSPTATSQLVETPQLTPTRIPSRTIHTPISASQMRGEWRRITTADGLCTNWPVFVGVWYIGTDSTTLCYSTKPVDETTWPTRTVPLGTRVTAVDKFPPGGGEMYATDAGVCWYDGVDWRCRTPAEGYPYRDIRRIDHISAEEVLMLADAIAYQGQTYNIPEIVGMGAARPTWIAASEKPERNPDSGEWRPIPEIWVGTNGYGIVLIQPKTGEFTRYTTADGLPDDVIRDIEIGAGLRDYLERRVWVATSSGIGRWDGEGWTAFTTADGLPSNDIRGIAAYQDVLWAATAGGAAYYDGQSWQAFTHENGLPEGELNGVKFGADGIWFSTRGSGLLVFVIQIPIE